MQKNMALDFKQLIGKPVWLSIFVLVCLTILILPVTKLSDVKVFPGLVYFTMVISLLFALYGAKKARLEKMKAVPAQERAAVWLARSIMSRLAIWLGLAFFVYLILYAAVLVYIGFLYRNISLEGLRVTFIYTLLCWCIPFFYSTIIGYVIYSWVQSYYGYSLIVVVWFLTMPYNSILGFIPRRVAGWLVNGDPNIMGVLTSQSLESIEVNNGFYVQRMFMFLVLMSLYLLVSCRRRLKIKVIATGMLIAALIVPMLSPFVPYIEAKGAIQLAAFHMPTNEEEMYTDYTISKYVFRVRHGRSNHDLRYTVDMNIISESNRIHVALLNDFYIRSAWLNHSPVIVEREGEQLVILDLPEKQGILHMEIETKTSHSIGPNTVQLVATSPWYPMNPIEADNPYGKASKEQYEIYWSSPAPNGIWSNLNQISDLHWSGEAYGPTLLMGRFKEKRKLVYPNYKTIAQAKNMKQRLETLMNKQNVKYQTAVLLPSNLYYVSAFHGLQANPDEAYISSEANLDEDIERAFFRSLCN